MKELIFNEQRFVMVMESVKKAPEKRFEMGAWVNYNGPSECGTTRCAIAWHCFFNPTEPLKMSGDGRWWSTPVFFPEGKVGTCCFNYEAVGSYLGISPIDALMLFGENQKHETKEAVLARLNEYLSERGRGAVLTEGTIR